MITLGVSKGVKMHFFHWHGVYLIIGSFDVIERKRSVVLFDK